jgi:hypothetical protein
MIETFEELVEEIKAAQDSFVKECEKPLKELLDIYYQSTPFALGHILGMRDCLKIVQQIATKGEEE